MKVLVGLSGGVDSAVSAQLLIEAGHEVHAGFMINYLSDEPDCTTRIDLAAAKEVAEFLKIPFFTFDYQKEYEERIISTIYDGYERWLTPNPDILCNNLIKFDLFLEEALNYGYDAIAMGHYAQIEKRGKYYSLLKGIDPSKDQTYFLSRLSQDQLRRALFPIGHLLKKEVRDLALQYNLPNALRRESQGLCFIGKVSMQEFLARRIKDHPGNILDISGNILGQHQGVHQYTIGQRKGISLGGGPALFVVSKDSLTNTIVVDEKESTDLSRSTLRAHDLHLIHPHALKERISAKIRYRQEDLPVCISYEANGDIRATFTTPIRAIAAGQAIVFYEGDVCLGAATIME